MIPTRFLLDTHVLLWLLTDPERLTTTVREALVDTRSRLYVSAASAWEIATKQRLGKLPQADALVRGYEAHLTRMVVESIDITAAHSLLAGALDWSHRDPFDRMIAAQCMLESLPLVSADEAFGTLAGVRVWW